MTGKAPAGPPFVDTVPARPARPPGGPVTVDRLDSIGDADPGAWDRLVGSDGLYQSHAWLQAVEKDNTATARYLVARAGEVVVGALPVYHVHHEASPSYSGDRFRGWFGTGGDVLLAGARRGYRAEILLADGDAGSRVEVAARLIEAAAETARAWGLPGIGFYYAPSATADIVSRVAPTRVAFMSADSVIEGIGGGIAALLARSPGKLRAKVSREMRRFDEQAWVTRHEPLAECLDEVSHLVSRVEARHGHVSPDLLLKRLMKRELRFAGGRDRLVTCRDADERLLACAVNYEWRDTLISRAVGLDYERLGTSFAYFNVMIYRSVQLAAGWGLHRLNLGQASTVKVERGGQCRPLWGLLVEPARRAPQGPWGSAGAGEVVNPAWMDAWFAPYRRYRHALRESKEERPGSGAAATSATFPEA